jgi:hypothetical protein
LSSPEGKQVQLRPEGNQWKKWSGDVGINSNSIKEIEKMYYCALRQQTFTEEFK